MKKLLAALLLVASFAHAGPSQAPGDPYFKGLWGANLTNPQVSAGAIFSSKGVSVSAFTNLALVYHNADAEHSLIPAELQAYIPPETWTLLNVGFGGSGGNYVFGLGSSVNLAGTVQGYASSALLSSSNPKFRAFGSLIAPGASPVSINAGPQLFSTILSNGTILPVNHWHSERGWFVGGTYHKRF